MLKSGFVELGNRRLMEENEKPKPVEETHQTLEIEDQTTSQQLEVLLVESLESVGTVWILRREKGRGS